MIAWVVLFQWTLWAQGQGGFLEELVDDPPADWTARQWVWVCAGADSESDVKARAERYEAFVQRLALSDKEASRSDNRKMKILEKKIKDVLQNLDARETDVGRILQNGTYSKLTAAYMLLEQALSQGVDPSGYKPDDDVFERWFFEQPVPDLNKLVAALFVHRAEALDDAKALESAACLRFSNLLMSQLEYGRGVLEQPIYDKAVRLFQSGELMASAAVTVAASDRFPHVPEFQPLCLNLAAMLIKDADAKKSFARIVPVCEELARHADAHKAQFDALLLALRFNAAIELLDKGELEGAWDYANQIENHPEPAKLKTLKVQILETRIQRAMDAGDSVLADSLKEALGTLDPERAQLLSKRMEQLRTKQLVEAGQYQEALDIASHDIESEVGLKNYFSVLTRVIQSNWDGATFQEGLDLLSRADDAIKRDERHGTLMRDTYRNWYASLMENKEYARAAEVVQKGLSDSHMQLTAEDRKAMLDDHAHILFKEIEFLVGEDQFRKADTKSKQALKRYPKHPDLTQQRKLIDTILERIGG